MKNKLSDLNDHLFAQIERLGDESLSQEQIEKEVKRSHAVTTIAREIIAGGKLQLDAQKALEDHLIEKAPAMLLESK